MTGSCGGSQLALVTLCLCLPLYMYALGYVSGCLLVLGKVGIWRYLRVPPLPLRRRLFQPLTFGVYCRREVRGRHPLITRVNRDLLSVTTPPAHLGARERTGVIPALPESVDLPTSSCHSAFIGTDLLNPTRVLLLMSSQRNKNGYWSRLSQKSGQPSKASERDNMPIESDVVSIRIDSKRSRH